ncbi:hypothetical protein V5O48_008457 [Marasmius crinis-equi]|uniref:Allantoin permease n=1 Tax=Marasmius crinis-equi TaxID=585013 RepID=A0ABR3FEI0_9AGAR
MNPPQSQPQSAVRRFLKRIEVPIDEDAHYKNDHWTNRDLIPMPADRRTYKIWSYFIYWCVSGMCISAYSLGATLLAFGLTPQQATGAIVVGALCVGLLSVACGWMGERHHIGFTVACRYTWGMRGAYFPVVIGLYCERHILVFKPDISYFLTKVLYFHSWDGLQAYWGGQAMTVMLGAIIPGLAHMKSTLAGGILMTKDLIGMLYVLVLSSHPHIRNLTRHWNSIYYIFFLAIMTIPPERLQRPFIVSSVLFCGTLIGLLAWAVSTVGGGGPMWKEPGTPVNGNVGWSMVFAITSILGAWGGGTNSQSDWTRYANRPYAPTLSQMVAAPLVIIVTATVGILVTSCAQQITGQVIWNPIILLGTLQDF